MSDSITVQCKDCGIELDQHPTGDRHPRACPTCGSQQRVLTIEIHDKVVRAHDQMLARVQDPSKTGKAKTPIEIFSGDDLHRKSGKWHRKERLIDRSLDRYREVVTAPETGEVIHYCDEALSQHQGYGSARAGAGAQGPVREQSSSGESRELPSDGLQRDDRNSQ